MCSLICWESSVGESLVRICSSTRTAFIAVFRCENRGASLTPRGWVSGLPDRSPYAAVLSARLVVALTSGGAILWSSNFASVELRLPCVPSRGGVRCAAVALSELPLWERVVTRPHIPFDAGRGTEITYSRMAHRKSADASLATCLVGARRLTLRGPPVSFLALFLGSTSGEGSHRLLSPC